ncbi:MAG: PKD domain-containing protein [Salinivirgaceae bacterium]|nr:PKD domain-containing protein [Salinivirgaceae bacterium]
MKTLQISLLLLFLVGINGNIKAQDYLISFAVLGENGTPDSVMVENLNQLTNITLNGNDVLHLVEKTTGISSAVSFNQPLKVAPNPLKNSGTLTFYNPKSENVNIGIYNSAGHLITQKTEILAQGEYSYKLDGIGVGTYIVNVSSNSSKRSVVLISNLAAQSEPSIIHVNSDFTKLYGGKKSCTNATKNSIEMQYNDGENLKFTAFKNSFTSVEELLPTSNQSLSFNFSAPTAAFSVSSTEISEEDIVTFTDQSSNKPDSWSWNFGDGNTSTEANPSYTYNNAGSYTVELTVTNSYGSDTETKIDYITVESAGTVVNVTDIDGNVYSTTQIGEQRWMAENLKTTTYNDGTSIDLVSDNTAWENNSTGAYCWLNNDETQYGETNGALYNWNAVNTGNLCPDGWHVPTNDEWTELKNYIAADGHSGNEGTALRATSGWPNDGNGTDDYGFTALPGDMRFDNGNFSDFNFGYWWGATEFDSTNAWFIGLYGNYAPIYQSNYSKSSGYSVRCLKD